jgi:hypothetical protein
MKGKLVSIFYSFCDVCVQDPALCTNIVSFVNRNEDKTTLPFNHEKKNNEF